MCSYTMPRVVPGYKEDVRRRIVKAALEEVNECGLHALRMEDVAARVGISRATLYNYFSDKEALLNAILEEMKEEGKAIFEDTFQDKSFRDILSLMFELMVISAMNLPSVEAELFSIASRTPDIQQSMQMIFEEGVRKLSERIQEGQQNGEISSGDDPRCLAEIVMYTLGGLKNAVFFGTDCAVLKKRWSAMTDMLFFVKK
ncbi:TetR/AcrR family transcriptional regulator [Methanogenium organophilum]|uniref:TetR/AcrR family transcriptional regulator n=1 Tax=Methanogenium organophilum TaxID=2199 RepID=A0A9X9S1L6_METOG|nr:TetR/AcrR family transcriptional regulator [Methanogenium organophilum]WAI00194.1 TetR/AcrR family transcriptional regulator [Methanogenium organophilum]